MGAIADPYVGMRQNSQSFAGQALTQHKSALPQDKLLASEDLLGAKQKTLSSTLDKAAFTLS